MINIFRLTDDGHVDIDTLDPQDIALEGEALRNCVCLSVDITSDELAKLINPLISELGMRRMLENDMI